MKTNLRKALAAGSVAMAALVASTAFAGTVTLTPTVGGGFSGSFTSVVNGSFFDDFTFSPASFAGDVTISLTPTSGQVSFFTALFQDGQGFGFTGQAGDPFTFDAMITADQPLDVQIFGFAGDAETLTAGDGAYSGTISISAPVPEPASIAMVLSGLAGVAFSARRRRARQVAKG